MSFSPKKWYLFVLLASTVRMVHAQNEFISANASSNAAKAALATDGDPATGWSPGDVSQDQYLLLTLQTPGDVDRLQIVADGLPTASLKAVFVTYDPMNPGNAVTYTITGKKPLTLRFPPQYGAHVKLVFKAGTFIIREVHVGYAEAVIRSADTLAAKPWLNAQLPVEQRVNSLLAVMTPAQKMELLREGWGIPGIPSLGIPAMNKVEAIHGFSYGSGATIFPQSIALGATWDKALVEKVAMTIGEETVSAHTVEAWSPVLDVAQDPRWGRCEETYGEDPVLVSEIGGAWIKGYQSKGLIVTPKHFAVHGAVMGGRDSHDIGLSEREIREIHLVPFRHVIETYHCQSIMMAYSDFEGVPVAKSKELLKGILRDEWGFDGYIVSDCGALGNMTSRKHYTAKDVVEAANEALAAGIATNCGDTYNNPAVIAAAQNGGIDMENLDYTCRTLLRVMFRNGFFEHNPMRPLDWHKIYPGWNSPEHKAIAREAAREAIVLLKNEGNLLPLAGGGNGSAGGDNGATIAVIGPGADDLQPGDYTPKLQPGQLVSVLSGIRQAAGEKTKVLHEKGCAFTGDGHFDPQPALDVAAKADVVVMVLGDCSTSEAIQGVTKTSGENNDYSSLILPGNQERLLEAVCATGKPVVLVLQSGRPYNLSYAAEHCKAILVNWLPGQEGGPALADVLFGAYNPAGRLPMTFPRSVSQLPLYYNFKTSGRRYDYVDMSFHPLYPFGYGLSYTRFSYAGLTTLQHADGTVSVKVTVTNTGSLKGDEVAQLYVTDMYASVKTRVMELKDFQRINLAPGESKEIAFTLTPYQLSLLNDNMDRVVEAGDFRIMVGGCSPSFVAGDRIKNSVGYASASDGLVSTLNYTAAYKADFALTPGLTRKDEETGKNMVAVSVENTGNLTDAGQVTLYVNGAEEGDVRHFELVPGVSKTIWFPVGETGTFTATFATKYRVVSKNYSF
ncbi:glycoside hydrolase family 3 C-terminal domain-containing protein [Dinghuibacter silviterrae]|uniref:Beta-glucosidase n=1 Tax=Dinghuibacter silviterrae TaxID=1539049 RepID=A0A4R8DQ69_9BACT|nr:glycoside hydrolase family 3 N-terminal domain-containing protein [Dinghuibacter silviterrae]TDW99907.1 beta-glucosidase [Dinghuibacter silviterrae]